MLLQIRAFIQREHIVSNQQIARAFNINLLALQPILDLCLRKQMIETYKNNRFCAKKCQKCLVQSIIYYQITSDLIIP